MTDAGFSRVFRDRVASVRRELDRQAANAAEPDFSAQLPAIAQLRRDLNDAVPGLLAYDLRLCSQALDTLLDALARHQARLYRRPKFQFRRRTDTRAAEAATPAPEAGPEENLVPERIAQDHMVQLAHYRHCELAEHSLAEQTQLVLVDMTACRLRVDGDERAAALSAVQAKDMRECECDLRVPVDGPVHVTCLKNCTVSVTCHQLRVHDCENTVFRIECVSDPIIEDSRGLVFRPLRTTDSNRWAHVRDFNWHRSTPSPNFTLAGDED